MVNPWVIGALFLGASLGALIMGLLAAKDRELSEDPKNKEIARQLERIARQVEPMTGRDRAWLFSAASLIEWSNG